MKRAATQGAWAFGVMVAVAVQAGESTGSVSPAEARKLAQTYGQLSTADRQKLRQHADELRQMTPEERAWALQNQDAMRALGDMPDEDRKTLRRV